MSTLFNQGQIGLLELNGVQTFMKNIMYISKYVYYLNFFQ